LPDLKTKGRVLRGWLGVAIQDITSELAESLKLAQGSGVLVSEVVKGGPADTAGLRASDLIVEVNASKIKDASHIVQLISSLRPGEKAILKVLRDSQ
jgi:S1-C subfamily serine protease